MKNSGDSYIILALSPAGFLYGQATNPLELIKQPPAPVNPGISTMISQSIDAEQSKGPVRRVIMTAEHAGWNIFRDDAAAEKSLIPRR